MRKILSVIIFMFAFSLKSFSQVEFDFDKEKWHDDSPDTLTTSYRGTVTDNRQFFDMLIGKNKKQVIELLGKSDRINAKSLSKKTVGYVYCIDKTTVDTNCVQKFKKCNPCKKSSVTIIFKQGKVGDIVGVHTSG